jgi:hypothetical protein
MITVSVVGAVLDLASCRRVKSESEYNHLYGTPARSVRLPRGCKLLHVLWVQTDKISISAPPLQGLREGRESCQKKKKKDVNRAAPSS